jgi:hypothetical protein
MGKPDANAGDPPELQALEGLAWLLDSSIPIPGTRMRIGLDALLGLIPVVGDLIGMALSSFILIQAARMGVPRVTLLRMGFNVTLEAVVGLIPFAGDAFDMAWKSNKRNVDLLRAHVRDPGRARRGDWLFASAFILFAIALAGGLAWAGFAIGRALFG